MSYHIPGPMCVGVMVWFGWGGVVSLGRLRHCWSAHVGCGGWGLMAIWNSDIKLVYIYSTIKMMHGPINIRYEVISISPYMGVTVMVKDKGLVTATHYKPQPSCGGAALVFHIQGGSNMTGTDFFFLTIITKHSLAHVSLQHTPLRSQHIFSNVLEAS